MMQPEAHSPLITAIARELACQGKQGLEHLRESCPGRRPTRSSLGGWGLEHLPAGPSICPCVHFWPLLGHSFWEPGDCTSRLVLSSQARVQTRGSARKVLSPCLALPGLRETGRLQFAGLISLGSIFIHSVVQGTVVYAATTACLAASSALNNTDNAGDSHRSDAPLVCAAVKYFALRATKAGKNSTEKPFSVAHVCCPGGRFRPGNVAGASPHAPSRPASINILHCS